MEAETEAESRSKKREPDAAPFPLPSPSSTFAFAFSISATIHFKSALLARTSAWQSLTTSPLWERAPPPTHFEPVATATAVKEVLGNEGDDDEDEDGGGEVELGVRCTSSTTKLAMTVCSPWLGLPRGGRRA